MAKAEKRITPTGAKSEDKKKAERVPWLEVFKVVPQIGWLALAGFLFYWFLGPLSKVLDQSSITKLGIGVVQIEFAQKQIQQAAGAKNQDIPNALKDRIERAPAGFFTIALLWVDDNPGNNLSERRALSSLGVTIDTAKSTEEALATLVRSKYDLVISDLTRDEKESAFCSGSQDQFQPANAGCNFMRRMQKLFEDKKQKAPPLIFYSGFVDPEWGIPVYSFGATGRVDELFHLVMDALERRGGTR
jgi:CheY-like chemotaxis protein